MPKETGKLFDVPASPKQKAKLPGEKPQKKIDLDKGIEELVGAICDPIIVWPGGGWENDIPDDLKAQIKIDRLIMCAGYSKGEPITATDSEALAYMMPLTLERPIDRDWTEIYLYLGTQYTKSRKVTMPEDIRIDKLTDYQMRHLNDLKAFIYNSRVKHRTETRAKIKKDRKEAEAAEKERLQPALFDF